VAHARAKLTPVWPAPAGRSGAGVRVDGRGCGAGRRRFPGHLLQTFPHRPSSGIPVRFERARPGELLHLDVKKLGRIPPGGVHRMRGRSTETDRFRKRHRPGYDYLHVAVDDHSRVAFVRVFRPSAGSVPATSSPAATAPRPTARPNDSSGPCSPSGPTSGSTGPTRNA
jgi:hypothetical protein